MFGPPETAGRSSTSSLRLARTSSGGIALVGASAAAVAEARVRGFRPAADFGEVDLVRRDDFAAADFADGETSGVEPEDFADGGDFAVAADDFLDGADFAGRPEDFLDGADFAGLPEDFLDGADFAGRPEDGADFASLPEDFFDPGLPPPGPVRADFFFTGSLPSVSRPKP
jgi:hypothetical protein